MSFKSEIFESTLKNTFDITRFVTFSKEFFNNLTLIRPDKFMEDGWNWSEYNFYVKGYYHIANFSGSDKSKIAVFVVEMKSYMYIDKARSIQRNFIKKLLVAGGMDAGIVAFYSSEEPKWRLSFIKIDYEFAKGKATEKLTPAKRYSYLVGDGEPCHTAMERLYPIFMNEKINPTLSEIEDAFSVEKVTKEFFEKYKEKYLQFKEHLDGNEDFVLEAERLHFTSEQFAKKMMGQLAFLYFIQKKGWLGVNAFPKQLNASEFKKSYYRLGKASQEVLPKSYKQISEDEYIRLGNEIDKLSVEDQEILAASVNGQPWGTGPKNFIRELFKICSNKGTNFFDDYLEPLFYEALNEKRGANDYYSKLKCRVPFLNGGLFEAIDNYDWNRNDFKIPNEMFSNIDIKGEENADGILDIFDRYNFTMNEDEPLEKEVAVDPEMLGKIFENLLDVKDRKSKGAFYTPREIVHYMCQESLTNYLVNTTGISYAAIKDFVVYGEFYKDEDTNHRVKKGLEDTVIPKEIFDMKNNINKLKEIDNALIDIRVADPAVGSGAFPLGMLSEIIKLRRVITEYMVMLTDNKMQIKMIYDSERHPLVLKLQTIKNSIFAVDIDPSAVDITKLRLWLSLVVEQDTDENAEDESVFAVTRNPRPLPNLDCNIRCGNSLIDELDGVKLVKESDLFGDSEGQIIFNQSKYDSLLKQLFETQDKLFYEKNHVTKEEYKQRINYIIDSIIRFNLESSKPEIIKKYQLVKENHSLPYFLWQLEFAKVFMEKGGFDVIIGNPPYIKERDSKHIFDPVTVTRFGKLYHQGKMDYWYYFLHKAIDLSHQKTTISLITPRYWLNSMGATKLIQRIKSSLDFKVIVDIGNLKTFDNVVGHHMIAIYQNDKGNCDLQYKKLMNNLSCIMHDTESDNLVIRKYSNENIINSNFEIVFFEENHNCYDGCKSLGQICDISQGVVEAADKVSKKMYEKFPNSCINVGDGVFVLPEQEIHKINLSDKEQKILRKYLDGNDTTKYNICFSGKYLIYSDKDIKKLIETDADYINIKKHIDRMSDYITSSNKPYGIHRPREKKYFENPKIITPSMFKSNQFSYDVDNHYVGMSYSVIISEDEEFDLKFLLGILNSKFALKWFYENGKHRGSGVDIGVEKLRSFPIKICSREEQEKIIRIVNEIIAIKKIDKNANTDNLEEEIDNYVLDLYER